MTEPEDFLTRWSRRKRETKAEPADRPQRDQAATPDAAEKEPQAQRVPAQSSVAKHEDIFDSSKLPSLDSIESATDIRAFLQPGVPDALSRAALRRAWSADPAIRDFIGLAENSWDFTASDGVYGFGALDPEEAKRLFAQLLGSIGDETESAATGMETSAGRNEAEQAQSAATEADSASGGAIETSVGEPATDSLHATLQARSTDADSVASQQEEAVSEPDLTPLRRGHGRALPQ